MSVSNQLIEKFFRGDCTEEEKQQVAEFFRNNPEKLAQYLTEDSWRNFDPDIQQGAPTDKIREAIEARVGNMPAPAPVRRIRYAWVAAASVIAVTSLVFLLHRPTGAKSSQPLPPGANNLIGVTSSPLKHIQNSSSTAKTFFLPDGSKVALSDKTSISFDSAFTNSRRDIYLEGEAVFTVKKDPKPFTVHCKGITTTALGTVFSVSDKKGKYTMVHLFSGKVVVKKENQDRAFTDIYLVPGQQLAINKENFSVQIRNPAPAVKAHVDSAVASTHQLLTFNNRPLAEIFSLLQKEYKISITYDPAAMQNMTFTGQLNRNKESLDSFLNTLCDLNDLVLRKNSVNSFSIQVKQP